MKKGILKFILICSLLVVPIMADEKGNTEKVGTIKGKLVDQQTKESLAGANVIVVNQLFGAATDLDGNYTIQNIPVGNYVLQFSYVGYEAVYKTDVIIRPDRITYVNVELNQLIMESETISVTAGYFVQKNEQPISAVNFSREEIRRAPGSAGDVSRIIMGLPSIAKVNDQSNSLIVRGGSPIENSFFIDNIEIPNINHFPTHGSSGGPIGILNVDFIDDVEFYSGGFSPAYGDRLSSIMNIRFREGNRDQFNGQLDLNWAGFGGVFEGPLFNQKGSWLFSARRSYLDWVIKMFDIGTSLAPSFGDVQGKVVYDINKQHQLTVLSIFADSHSKSTKKIADENAMTYYGDQDIYELMAGINWRMLWEKTGFSNTSLSLTSARYEEDFYKTTTEEMLLENRSLENTYTLRNFNHLSFNNIHTIQMGFEWKHIIVDYNNLYPETMDPIGNIIPEFRMKKNTSSDKLGLFINYRLIPLAGLTLNLGLRADYFTYNANGSISPKFSLSYKVNDRMTINSSAGIYNQNLPILLLSQDDNHLELKDMWATHMIVGMDYLLTENTMLTLEGYHKEYKNFPLDPTQPGFFIIDELTYNYGFFTYHENLNDRGKSFTSGLELILQKKLADDIYGMASASYFRSRYADQDDVWRDRVYDNRLTFNIEGGYKPNSEWEFSTRWIYGGGTPYTPFDQETSKELNQGVLDSERINKTRYSDYHSLNIRVDKRFHFNRSNLIVYLSVWNVYDRKNVASYYWNEQKNEQDVIYQWRMLPIFGLEYEF